MIVPDIYDLSADRVSPYYAPNDSEIWPDKMNMDCL